MSRMFITGIGTATPPHCYTQNQCWEVFARSPLSRQLEPRSRAIIKKVLTGDNGISTRHLALETLEQAFELTPDALHARFAKNAPDLASQAATKALQDAGCELSDIDAVLISTCTGYLCPGLTSYVSEQLGLRPNVLTLDFVGQGCGAALPNLRTAHSLLESGQCQRVLSICVEICSAALYFDNDPGVLISACLFGDGAGAAVLSRAPNGAKSIEWKTCGSLLKTSDRDLLRFEQRAGMLRNLLSAQVPSLAGRHASQVFRDVLGSTDIKADEIRGWILHPGGRDILTALRQSLGLSADDTRWSASVLNRFGNLSSSSIFFVLETALADSASSGYWWVSSFGAGFSCHGALLKVDLPS
jgi:predicted naringenin-chalcone synthase